jgi:preprotein translocase SecE subunit
MFSLTKNPVSRYFIEARDELKKITWPTQRQAFLYSAFVVGTCIVLAAYFGALDELLTIGLKALVTATARS